MYIATWETDEFCAVCKMKGLCLARNQRPERELRYFCYRANNFREIEHNKSILSLDPNYPITKKTIRMPNPRYGIDMPDT